MTLNGRRPRGVPSYLLAAMAALQFQDSEIEPLRRLTEDDWHELLEFGDLAHLTLPLLPVCKEVAPDWVVSRIERNFCDNSRRVERIKTAYQELAGAFADAGVKHLMIKGLAQYPEYVESPAFHMQSDIDLYCPKDSIIAARDALVGLGYESIPLPKGAIADHLPIMARIGDWTWRGNAYDPEMPPSVELHFCFWNEASARFAVKGVDEFWDRRVVKSWADLEFPALSSVDNLGFCALHILRDLLRAEWVIHHVYEVARFLHIRANDASFWKAWTELHNGPMRSLEAISFNLAERWFRCDISEAVEAEIARLPPDIDQWLEDYSGSLISRMFCANKDALWLHLSLLGTRHDRLAVLRRAFIPKLPAVGGPGQDLTRSRRARKFWPSQRYARYLLHIIFRTGSYFRTLPSVLWRGLLWWLSQKRICSGFWIFLTASLFFDLGFSIFFFLFNLYLLDYGFNERSLGILTSAMAVGSIVGTIPAGMLAERFGIRRMLLVCIVLVTSISVMRALIAQSAAQIILAFLSGAGLCIWAVCLSPAVARLTTRENRPFAFSLVFSAGIGVGAIGGLAGGTLPGWLGRMRLSTQPAGANRLALLIACGIAALGAWPISRLRFAAESRRLRPPRLFHPFLIRFLPAIAAWSLVTGSFSPFANVYFARHLHLPLQHIGLVFSISQLTQVAGVLVAPIVFRRFGLIAGIMYTQLATSAALCYLGVTRGAWVAAAIYLSYTTAQWMSEPGMYSLLMNNVASEERSRAAALNFFVISLVQAIASASAGASIVRFGYPTVIGVIAGVAAGAAILFRLLLGDRRLAAVSDPGA